jgi:cell division protein FtsL
VSVVTSGIAVVYVKYLSRKHFVELQGLRAERDRIDVEWGRLQIEEAALSSQARLEAQARRLLSMRAPAPEAVALLREDNGVSKAP